MSPPFVQGATRWGFTRKRLPEIKGLRDAYRSVLRKMSPPFVQDVTPLCADKCALLSTSAVCPIAYSGRLKIHVEQNNDRAVPF